MFFEKLGDGAFHFHEKKISDGMLSRYGILNGKLNKSYADCSAEICEAGVVMHGAKRDVSVDITTFAGGYTLEIPLTERERLFGMGDANRDGIMIRGRTIGVWVCNVISYGPLPIVLSSDGWAILVNSTYQQKFDLGDSDPDKIKIFVTSGTPDFYLFTAKTLKETLMALTDITGKPTMLPAFGYGLTFVENEWITKARDLVEDAIKFREKKIPCDVLGLEPNWMGGYDFSLDKKWNDEQFNMPYWWPKNHSNKQSFLGSLRFTGMQLSLWLCEDYDLFYEEEREALAREEALKIETDEAGAEAEFRKSAEIFDKHLTGKIWDTKLTKPDEPWFEHLKKFVDNGAACFKLDGSNQVLEHPQRAWAEKFLDKEAHNAYPLVLAKQMNKGFRNHTGRRGMIYSAGGYVGIQKYAATWAGDTGGGPRTLVACMNYAMCGHTNTSCDMEVYDAAGIHYGFLQSWSQINGWAGYKLPWFLPAKFEAMIKDYSELRSSLFPYIYGTAHNASVTGVPILRPLPLMYEETDRFDGVTNAYMLGESLYVGAFNMNLTLPDGEWIDYFTGKKYSGSFKYEIPEGKGGALLAKAGSIIATMEPQLYINEREPQYIIKVFPGGNAEYKLYEDDRFTYDYEDGGYAETPFTLADSGNSCTLTVGKREGSFSGRVDNGSNILENSIPKINGISPVSDMKISVYGIAKSVTKGGSHVDFTVNNGYTEFTLYAAEHDSAEIKFDIEF